MKSSTTTSSSSSSSHGGRIILDFRTINNVRDLGNIPTSDGKSITRTGLLYRGASLADASEEELLRLHSLGVRTVVDFRTMMELKGRSDRLVPLSRYIPIPVDSVASDVSMEEEYQQHMRDQRTFDVRKLILLAAFNDKAHGVAQQLYPNIFFSEGPVRSFGKFLRLIIHDTDPSTAIFFHCTQGKDRAGVATALILGALGVGPDEILRDFDLTNDFYARELSRTIRRVKWMGGKERQVDVVRSFIGANTDNFRAALSRIEDEWGGMEGFLTSRIGLTPEELATLRSRYTRPLA